MPDEIWKDIVGYGGTYQVSSLGRVRSVSHVDSLGRVHTGKILSPQHRTKNYLSVKLSYNNCGKSHNIHRLVAEAFIPNPNCLPQVNHKDENKENNAADNLEWCDSKYNINYGTRTDKCRGENHWCAVLSEQDITNIRVNYIPCDKEYGGKALARKYSVSTSTISYIVRGKTWKHLL